MGDVVNLFDNENEDISIVVEYDDPDDSVWIFGVDIDARLYIVNAPNIDPSFFESGTLAEDLGLPVFVDLNPGLHRAVCRLMWDRYTLDDDIVDEDWWFEIVSTEPIIEITSGDN